MPSDLLSSLLLACLFGARHGIDADHLAAIDGLSRAYSTAGRPALARLSGVLFSAGHGVVVLAAALSLNGHRAALPSWLEGAGSLLSIALLTLLGCLNLAQALQPGSAAPSVLAASLLRWSMLRRPAGAFLTGVLFALSFDTLTLAAWLGTAAATAGSVAGAVLALAFAFVAGMICCDGLNGWWVAHLIQRSKAFADGARRFFSSLVALISLAIAALELMRLRWEQGDRWLDGRGIWISASVVALLLVGFLVAASRRDVSRRVPADRSHSEREPHASEWSRRA